MPSATVYTLDEISQSLRVPKEAIETEIREGRLTSITIAGHTRILEHDYHTYLNKLRQHAKTDGPTAHATAVLRPTPDFTHTWPAKKDAQKITEQFTNAHEGRLPHNGRRYDVRLGFTYRNSAEKRRRRSLVLIDNYPTVEFVAPDETTSGKMASIIRDANGKHVRDSANIPPEYQGFTIAPYNSIVIGAGAANGMAVICDQDDLDTMVRHALIRYQYREDRRENGRNALRH